MFAVVQNCTLWGNSLEGPLGELATSFWATLNTKRMQRQEDRGKWIHISTCRKQGTGRIMEEDRDPVSLNRGWICCVNGHKFVLKACFFNIVIPSHYPAILKQLTLLCDLMNKPASYCMKGWHRAGNTPCPKVQNTPPLCITHLRYLSSL